MRTCRSLSLDADQRSHGVVTSIASVTSRLEHSASAIDQMGPGGSHWGVKD